MEDTSPKPSLKTTNLRRQLDHMFSSAVEQTVSSTIFRNFGLWQMANPNTFPASHIPYACASTATFNVSEFHESGERIRNALPEVLAPSEWLADYFVNVGCANVFGQYVSDECLTKATQFFTTWISGAMTDLQCRVIGNFLLHSPRFTEALRQRFYLDIASQVERPEPQKKLEFLRSELATAIGDLTPQHLQVLKHCLSLENGNAALATVLVKYVLAPCLHMWQESSEFCAGTLLKVNDGKWLRDLLPPEEAGCIEFCEAAITNINLAEASAAARVTGALSDPCGLASALDRALLKVLLRGEKVSLNIDDAFRLSYYRWNLPKSGPVGDIKRLMPNYAIMTRGAAELKAQVTMLSVLCARASPLVQPKYTKKSDVASTLVKSLKTKFASLAADLALDRLDVMTKGKSGEIYGKDVKAKLEKWIGNEKVWEAENRVAKFSEFWNSLLQRGKLRAQRINGLATLTFSFSDMFAEGQILVALDNVALPSSSEKRRIRGDKRDDDFAYSMVVTEGMDWSMEGRIVGIHGLLGENFSAGRFVRVLELLLDMVAPLSGSPDFSDIEVDLTPFFVKALLGDKADAFAVSCDVMYKVLIDKVTAGIVPSRYRDALTSVHAWIECASS